MPSVGVGLYKMVYVRSQYCLGIDSAGGGSQIEPSESSQLKRKDPPT
ncbi:unnamed protein product [Arabidopsis lyrata]|nr:unnamed protein product [Arabidopsis lyrata]